MRTRWPWSLAALALLIFAAAGPVATTPRAEITLCFEDSPLPPFRLRNATGLNFDLINAAAARLDVQVQYLPTPWAFCQAEVAAGRVDGVIGLSFSRERAQRIAFPPGNPPSADYRLGAVEFVLVRRAGSRVRIQDGRVVGLTGTIGAQNGYSIVTDLRNAGLPVDDSYRDYLSLLQAIISGRVGAGTLGSTKMAELSTAGGPALAHIEVLAEPLVRKPYFLALSPALLARDPELAQSLWEAIRTERNSAGYRLHEATTLHQIELPTR